MVWQSAQTGKIGKNRRNVGIVLVFFRSMEKMAWDGPKWGQEDVFPTNPDLANILGRTDFDSEKFVFCDFGDLNFPRFPNSWAGPHPFCCRCLLPSVCGFLAAICESVSFVS